MNHELMTLTQVKKKWYVIKFDLLFALLCSRFFVLIFWNYLLYIFMLNCSVNMPFINLILLRSVELIGGEASVRDNCDM